MVRNNLQAHALPLTISTFALPLILDDNCLSFPAEVLQSSYSAGMVLSNLTYPSYLICINLYPMQLYLETTSKEENLTKRCEHTYCQPCAATKTHKRNRKVHSPSTPPQLLLLQTSVTISQLHNVPLFVQTLFKYYRSGTWHA